MRKRSDHKSQANLANTHEKPMKQVKRAKPIVKCLYEANEAKEDRKRSFTMPIDPRMAYGYFEALLEPHEAL